MTDLPTRVVHSYLTHLRPEYIARVEKISVDEVERIIARAIGVPRKYLRLETDD